MMKRRLYFMLPSVASAERTANDLLLARIEDRHMHFVARPGTHLGKLHEAGYAIRKDLLRGAEVGLVSGGLFGLVLYIGSLVLTAATFSLPHLRMQFASEGC